MTYLTSKQQENVEENGFLKRLRATGASGWFQMCASLWCVQGCRCRRDLRVLSFLTPHLKAPCGPNMAKLFLPFSVPHINKQWRIQSKAPQVTAVSKKHPKLAGRFSRTSGSIRKIGITQRAMDEIEAMSVHESPVRVCGSRSGRYRSGPTAKTPRRLQCGRTDTRFRSEPPG